MDARRGISALSFVQISLYMLIFTLYSMGIKRQLLSNADNVGHLQGEDD